MEGKIEKLERLIKKACAPLEGMPIALSGGIDSSLLSYYIKPRFALTVVSPGGEAFNEYKYAKIVAEHLKIKHILISADFEGFKRDIRRAIKIIGEPTPHFNIYPLYLFYKALYDLGEKSVVIADGPDESMSGYARNLIMNYLYEVYKFEAFEPYIPLISKILPIDPTEAYAKLTGSESYVKGSFKNLVEYMNRVDMEIKRPEMDIMASRLAKYFGIHIYKPYETRKVDNYMFSLPVDLKIREVEYGKYALRVIANKYLPGKIAWRKVKRGGPIFPVVEAMGWKGDKFDKKKWLEFQKKVLK